MTKPSEFSRRERQIMDAIFELGEATVNQVVAAIPDAPTAMAVRRMLHILEEKGHLKRRENGREVIYSPRESKEKAGRIPDTLERSPRTQPGTFPRRYPASRAFRQ